MTKRLLVTGSREWTKYEVMHNALEQAFHQLSQGGGAWAPIVLVHGAARGADTMAMEMWEHQWRVQPNVFELEEHPVTSEMWRTKGKGEGFARNARMVALGADLCVAFFVKDALNNGTRHCSDLARAAGIPVTEVWQ